MHCTLSAVCRKPLAQLRVEPHASKTNLHSNVRSEILPRRACRGLVRSLYYLLFGPYRYHHGRVDDDFAARLVHTAGTPIADIDGLSN